MDRYVLPRPNIALVDRTARPTNPYYVWMQRVDQALVQSLSLDELRTALQSLKEELDALTESGFLPSDTMVYGINSIHYFGSLANGQVVFQLVNDEANPGASLYYGTDDSGVRGFHELPSGGVPYFIPEGSTFRVREYIQALFSMPIDCEGFLDVDGYLVEVD